jgi:hypothetical protein
MLAIGSLLGGIVAALFGRNAAFALDAVTFLTAAFFIWRVVVPPRETAVPQPAVAGSISSTASATCVENRFSFVALAKAGGSLVWGAINVLEINFAEQIFPLPPSAFTQSLQLEDPGTAALGIIYVVSGLGTGIGPLLLRRILGDRPPRLMLGVGIGLALMGVGILGLRLCPLLSISY